MVRSIQVGRWLGTVAKAIMNEANGKAGKLETTASALEKDVAQENSSVDDMRAVVTSHGLVYVMREWRPTRTPIQQASAAIHPVDLLQTVVGASHERIKR